MTFIAEARRRLAGSLLPAILVLIALSIEASTAMAQVAPEVKVHIPQVAADNHDGQLPEPETDVDRGSATIWPQITCEGLGQSAAGCALSRSASEVPGIGNAATVIQRGSFNVARIIQEGAANVVHASQTGVGNSFHAEQIGDGNQIAANLVGDGNSLRIQQHGDDNAYLFSFEGDGLDHSLSQVGSGLKAVQLGTAHLPLSIEQRGTDMEIRIMHDPIGGWPQ